ncbi:MAG: PTS sugar transporter subunit IIA [Lentisphaerota bacterium]
MTLPFRVLSLDEVAEYLHLTKDDVDSLVRSGDIPFDRQGDRMVFRQRDIDAWASQRILGFSREGLKAFHKKSSIKVHDLSQKHAIIPELCKAAWCDPVMTSKTRASVIRDTVAMAEKTGLVFYAQELLKSVEERERLGSTALAGGMALLHPRNHENYMFGDSFIVLGRTIQPIPFGSPDGSTSDLFFLVCCQDDRIHLHVLARICMMCHQTSLLLELHDAQTSDEMFRLMVSAEDEIIKQL